MGFQQFWAFLLYVVEQQCLVYLMTDMGRERALSPWHWDGVEDRYQKTEEAFQQEGVYVYQGIACLY